MPLHTYQSDLWTWICQEPEETEIQNEIILYLTLLLCDLSHSRGGRGFEPSLCGLTTREQIKTLMAIKVQEQNEFNGTELPSQSWSVQLCISLLLLHLLPCIILTEQWGCSLSEWVSSGCSNTPDWGHLYPRFYRTWPINLNIDEVFSVCTSDKRGVPHDWEP